jgi:hypothetical protein
MMTAAAVPSRYRWMASRTTASRVGANPAARDLGWPSLLSSFTALYLSRSPPRPRWVVGKSTAIACSKLLGSEGVSRRHETGVQRLLRAAGCKPYPTVLSQAPITPRDATCCARGRGQSLCQRMARRCVRRSGERTRHRMPPGRASHVLSPSRTFSAGKKRRNCSYKLAGTARIHASVPEEARLRRRSGPEPPCGRCPKPRCMAARTMICR